MLGILNSDTRMNIVYQQLKDKIDCILLDDFSILKVKFDAIVLPMSGLRDDDVMIVRGIEMKCPVEFFSMLNENGLVITGNVTPRLKQLNLNIIDLNQYKEFIDSNSELTAEGILYLLIDNTTKSIKDLDIDLIGYGHSGKAIYNLLTKLNINVRVIRREVYEKQSNFITVEQYSSLKPYPIIINTSLTNIIDDLMIKKMDENLIINLVRNSSFNDILLRQRHCRIIHAGPLPAMFSFETAAKVLVNTLLDIFYEN